MKTRERRKYSRWLIFTMFTAAVLLWIMWANTALEYNEINIYSDRLPKTFDGYRIVQISDLHNAEFGKDNETLLQMLKEARPDMIVVTGDLVDSSRTDFNVALKVLRQAMQIAPVYYATGNHEAWLGQSYEKLESQLMECGVKVLRDEALFVEHDGMSILLMGLDDPEFYQAEESAYDNGASQMAQRIDSLRYDEEEYTIVLSHRPELFEIYVDHEVDLVFAGHAHGGQFRLPLIGGLVAPNQGFFPAYDAGLYQNGRTDMVVSRGLGNSVSPLRFANRPEIVVVELHCS